MSLSDHAAYAFSFCEACGEFGVQRRISSDGLREFANVGAEALEKDLVSGEVTAHGPMPQRCTGWREDGETGRRWATSSNLGTHWVGSDATGTYYTAGAEYGIDTKYPITLSGSFGYYIFDDDVFGNDAPDSYKDWKLGAAVDVGNFTFDLSYVDTDNDGEDLFGSWADDRFVATLSASF